MEAIFDQGQHSSQSHGRLLTEMMKIYENREFEEFWSEFQNFMKYFMVKFEREPSVERVSTFVCNFIISLSRQNNEVEDVQTDSESQPELVKGSVLQNVFTFISNYHNCASRAVRYRCCQLTHKLLTGLGDVMLEDELCQTITTVMLERLKDSVPSIREQAVHALACLQNPEDDNCPIIEAYLFHMEKDSHAGVRRAVVASIALLGRTLPAILARTKDLSETVRSHTFSILSEKVNIRVLSISQRLDLIDAGLNDRSANVRKICTKNLFKSWLLSCHGNLLELLYMLDVVTSVKQCDKILAALFEQYSAEELVKNVTFLTDDLLIDPAELDCEKVVYWRKLCEYLDSLGVNASEFLEKILPDTTVFCDYLKSFNQQHCIKCEKSSDVDQLEVQFIVEQLIGFIRFMELSDTATREKVLSLLHGMLVSSKTNNRWIRSIMTQLHVLKPDSKEILNYVCDVVHDIHEPIVQNIQGCSEEQRREVNLKVAPLRIKLHELRDELDQCLKNEDYGAAANVKNKINDLQIQKQELMAAMTGEVNEVTEVKNDPETLLKCLTIICETLELKRVSVKEQTIEILKESIILPSIPNESEKVRKLGFKCLGLCCLNCKETALRHLNIFLEACHIEMEVVAVKVTALQAIFDILLVFGMDLYTNLAEEAGDDEAEDKGDGVAEEGVGSANSSAASGDREKAKPDESGADDDNNKSGSSIMLALLCRLMESEVSEIQTVTAEGLAKLLLAGHVSASKVLTRLILLWFNPLSQDNYYLSCCLATFFPVFASDSALNQELLVESFLPVVKTLCNAPASSPLFKVDTANVCEFLVELTRPKPTTGSFYQENPNHGRILVQACNEILSNPNSSTVRPLSRLLNYLDLNEDSVTMLRDLRKFSSKILSIVKDKVSLKSLVKFSQKVEKSLSACEERSRDRSLQAGCAADSSNVANNSVSRPQSTTMDNCDNSTTTTSNNNNNNNDDAAAKGELSKDAKSPGSHKTASENAATAESNDAKSPGSNKTASENAASAESNDAKSPGSNKTASENAATAESNDAKSPGSNKTASENAASAEANSSAASSESDEARSECSSDIFETGPSKDGDDDDDDESIDKYSGVFG
ncbi:condensin complex subunit 3-like isoform X1 [Argonauta hians]